MTASSQNRFRIPLLLLLFIALIAALVYLADRFHSPARDAVAEQTRKDLAAAAQPASASRPATSSTSTAANTTR